MSGARAGGPLAGLRVAEVSSVVMAPMAGRLLAKLGATVVKVEPPGGDVVCRIGATAAPGMSGAAHSLGDGKYNIAIDLRTGEGAAELRRILRSADIVLTNHLPARRRAYGLDWESVREVNPRAVLCTAQGYASDSDLADTPAYDDTVQAASGVCDIYARAGDRPRYAPYVMADKVCALTIVYSVLAALHHRDAHGRGQWVDVPMVDVMVDFNLTEQPQRLLLPPAAGARGLAPDPGAQPPPAPVRRRVGLRPAVLGPELAGLPQDRRCRRRRRGDPLPHQPGAEREHGGRAVRHRLLHGRPDG